MRPITDDEIATFRADGVVVLRGLLDAQAVAAMAAPVERALLADEMADLGSLTGETGPRFAAGVDHWKVDDDFRHFACDAPLPAAAAALLGSDHLWLWEDSVLVKEPGSPHRTQFHTDAGYFNVSGEQVCTLWISLDPATPDSGGVLYVRGSHRWPAEYRPNLFTTAEPLPGTEGELAPDLFADPSRRDTLIGFDVEPGDVIVHHYRTLHGAPGNQSPTTRRRAISIRYCGDDVRYHVKPGVPRKPHHERVADGDPLGGTDCPQVFP